MDLRVLYCLVFVCVFLTSSRFWQVFVNLIDRNDNAPRFDPDTYTRRITEDAPPGTTIVRLTATDPDTGTDEGLTYTITGGNPGSECCEMCHSVASEHNVLEDPLTTLGAGTKMNIEVSM